LRNHSSSSDRAVLIGSWAKFGPNPNPLASQAGDADPIDTPPLQVQARLPNKSIMISRDPDRCQPSAKPERSTRLVRSPRPPPVRDGAV